MTFTKSSAAKLAAGVVGFAMTVSVFMPVLASADTASDLQAQINSLLATISSLQAQLSATTGGSSTGYTFNTNLTVGSTGADVMNLQKVLNMSADTKVASSGAGSPGSESSYFGGLTKAAVVKFQVKNGITPAVGYVGPITRAKLNAMAGTAPVVPPVVTPGLPTGGSLSVSAGSQPANSLAPQSASRVPFTTVVLSAGSSDVTVNSITVERVGLAQDAVFSGVVLLNSDGMQIAISGAQHTVNSTLSLGTATLALSSFDPNQAQTKEIGTTGYNFAGVRVTAGSVEQVKLWSVRWNQSGSASSNDLSNVKVYVDGTAYDTVVSSDGKYYSAVFAGGLLIDKGLSKDIYIQGDITGT